MTKLSFKGMLYMLITHIIPNVFNHFQTQRILSISSRLKVLFCVVFVVTLECISYCF